MGDATAKHIPTDIAEAAREAGRPVQLAQASGRAAPRTGRESWEISVETSSDFTLLIDQFNCAFGNAPAQLDKDRQRQPNANFPTADVYLQSRY